MKIHRILFVGLAAWAGMMAYRAHMLVAPLLPANMSSITDVNTGHSYGDSTRRGGIGGVTMTGNDPFSRRNNYVDNLRPAQDPQATLDLLKAAADGDMDALQKNIGLHVPLNSRDNDRRTALIYAAWNGRNEACGLLLASGANIQLQDKNGFNAMDYAAGRGYVETVQFMLQRAKLADDRNYAQYAQLMRAAYAGDKSKLPAGALASVGRISPEDQSPLMVAAGNGSVAVMEELVKRGGDINVQNAEKQTPLHWAAWNHQAAAITWLTQHGANKKITDKNGDTALTMALEKNYSDLVPLLQ